MARAVPKFEHKPVSEWFVLDWQFILATGRFPVFKPAVAVITALPFVSDLARVVPIGTTGFWLFWTASVLSLVTFVLTYFFCPDFIGDVWRRSWEQLDAKALIHPINSRRQPCVCGGCAECTLRRTWSYRHSPNDPSICKLFPGAGLLYRLGFSFHQKYFGAHPVRERLLGAKLC
jgi:hypothetical protein